MDNRRIVNSILDYIESSSKKDITRFTYLMKVDDYLEIKKINLN